MRKKIKILVAVILIGVITGFGLGLLFIFLGANEDLASGTIQLEGSFVEFDAAHYGRGTARIVTLPSGNRQLQFVDVDLAIGPDLFVYLSEKTSFSGIHDSPGTFLNLGALPYNSGNFSIGIHAATDLSNTNSVMIWCRAFSVVFTYAALN